MTKIIRILILSVVIVAVFVLFKIKSSPHIVVIPEKSLLDQPVEITVTNLKPNSQVTIEAVCKNKDGDQWKSYAIFKADNKGIVNVAQQSPIEGSYKGIDSMGLFWSMKPTDTEILKKLPNTFNFYEVFLSVLRDGKFLTRKTIQRLPVAPNIEKREIREQGLVGTLFYPTNILHGPGVIVLGGSSGGIPKQFAQLIASHGYVVLALAYFNAPGLPKTLQNIPLEYFKNAIHWFQQLSLVERAHVAILGGSRGGELVLLLSSIFPNEIHAVIAYVPSSFINVGYPNGKPAWTYKYKSFPFVRYPSNEEIAKAEQEGIIPVHKKTFDDPAEPVHEALYALKYFKEDLEPATIPVENIKCPILIISSEQDKLWPSSIYANHIEERLKLKRSTVEIKHLHFADAGHIYDFPFLPIESSFFHPVSKTWLSIGGTVEGNAHAIEQAWKFVLEFLKETLGK